MAKKDYLTLCQPAQSLPHFLSSPRCVIQRGVELRAVLASSESNFEVYNAAWSPLFCEYLCENKIICKTIKPFIPGLGLVRFMNKNCLKSRHTASFKQKKLVELLTSYVSVYCQKTTNKLIRYSEVCERGADGCGSGQKLLNKLT